MITYRLEAQCLDGEDWVPVVDGSNRPLAYTGPSGKAQARNIAELMCRWPSFVGLRVMKSDEPKPVWQWTKQGGK